MNAQKTIQPFYIGSHLCREPMPPMEEMKRDMELLKRKGFNLIKLQENWMIDEPQEGHCDFSRYHELIEHAARLDMGVYLGLTCEQAPNWLFERYPDCAMELRDGRRVAYRAQTTLTADGKPGPCYDHPDAMAAQLRFIGRLVRELGAHENIVVFNTWQEIGYWAENLAGDGVCFCPNTLKAYRGWLRQLYGGDIEALNRHWNCRYAGFDSVEPDRSIRPLCAPQYFYFRYFMDNVQVANVLRARCEAIRQADPLGRPVFAHKGGMEIGSAVDWQYARCQDFLGVSNYPAWGAGHPWDDSRQQRRLERHDALKSEMWDGLAFKMDYLRSASKPGAPVWAAEYQGGPVSTDFHPGRIPDAADMRRWMLTTLGSGATALCFWISRAEIMAPETNGFALLDSEGDSTPRLEEAARIADRLKAYPELFARNNRAPAQVALVVDEWNHQLTSALSFAPQAQNYNLRGWYKVLWEAGISCDFVDLRFDADRLNDYRAVIVPMPLSMSDEVAGRLLDYAEAGGQLILEGGCGRLSDVALAQRGQMHPKLRAALGCSVTSFRLVREPGDQERWSQRERTWGEYEESRALDGCGALQGIRLRPNVFIERYDAPEEAVCLRFGGEAAGLVRDTGKGRVWLLGSLLGFNATAYTDQESLRGLVQLLALADVHPEHSGRLLLRKRLAANLQAWFVTNPCREALTEELPLPQGARAEDLLGEPLEAAGQGVRLTVDPLDVRVLLVHTA